MTMYLVHKPKDLVAFEQERKRSEFAPQELIAQREEPLTAEQKAGRETAIEADRKRASEAAQKRAEEAEHARDLEALKTYEQDVTRVLTQEQRQCLRESEPEWLSAADEHARVVKAEAEAQRVAKTAEEARMRERNRAQSAAIVGAVQSVLGNEVPALVARFSAAYRSGEVCDGAARSLAPALAGVVVQEVAALVTQEEIVRAVKAVGSAISCTSLAEVPETLERMVGAMERTLVGHATERVTAVFASSLNASRMEAALREAGERAWAEAQKAQIVLKEQQKKTRLDAAYEHLAPQLAKRLARVDQRVTREFVDEAKAQLFAEDGSVRPEYVERDGRVRAALRLFLMEPRTEWRASPVYLDQLKEGFGWILEREWAEREKVAPVASASSVTSEPAPQAGVRLPEEVRNKAAQSLGQPLGDMRVHPESAAAAGARAAAVGDQIHVAEGAYRPDTAQGQLELMHELVHVAQQRGQGEEMPAGLDPALVRTLLEVNAGWAAEAMLRGDPVAVLFRARFGMWQGFEAWEHEEIGEKGGGGRRIRLNDKVTLDFKDVVWLAGDLFQSVEGLKKAPPELVVRLLAVLKKQKASAQQGCGRPSAQQQAEIDTAFQDETKTRERTRYEQHRVVGQEGDVYGGEVKSFDMLANDNAAHFSDRNLKEWSKEHKEALQAARLAQTDPGHKEQHLNEALLHEAFGAHFLTDAFAAGHLVDGEQGRKWAWEIIHNEYAQLLDALLAAGRADQEMTAELMPRSERSGFPLDLLTLGAFSYSLGAARDHKGALASLLLKAVHDALNERGMEVRNRRGDLWRTAGDSNLSKAPRTYELAAEAVRLGREEVEAVAEGKAWVTLSPAALVPNAVHMGGKWSSLDEFGNDKEIFLSILRPRIFDRTLSNRLYQMIRAHMLPVAKEKSLELLIEAGHLVGHGAASFGRAMVGVDVPAGPSLDAGVPSGSVDDE